MNFLKRALRLGLTLQLLAAAAQAGFDDRGVGGRAPGMADSFVGVADDVNALYYNPAGLAIIPSAQVSTEYSQILQGTSDGSSLGTAYVGWANPLRLRNLGTIALAYHNFKASGLLNERTLYMSYGTKLDKNPFGWPGHWFAGATIKQFHRQYEIDRFAQNSLNDSGTGSSEQDPLLAKGLSSTAYGVDLGTLVLFGPHDKFSAGLMLMNVNQPDVSIAHDGDKVPLTAKIGIGIKPEWGLLSAELRRAERVETATDSEWAVGAERNFTLVNAGNITVRGGYASGSRNYKAVTAGLSFTFDRVKLDYAFNAPTGSLADSSGSHRFGLSVQMPVAKAAPKNMPAEEVDFLSVLRNNTAATMAMANAASADLVLKPNQQMALYELILKSHPASADTMKIMDALKTMRSDEQLELSPWPDVVATLTAHVSDDEQPVAENALNVYAKGDARFALARLALLSPEFKKDKLMTSVQLLALTDLASNSYRQNDIDTTIDRVRPMLDLLPQNAMVKTAYRKLLLMRSGISVESAPVAPPPATEVQTNSTLPEAPATLVAPSSITGNGALQQGMTPMDLVLTRFGIVMGHYLSRKTDGATLEERLKTLEDINAEYAHKGIDLWLVERELAEVQKSLSQVSPVLAPTPVPTPNVATPTVQEPEPENKELPPSVETPIPGHEPVASSDNSIDDEFALAWAFYERASDRGLSDRERMELLEKMLTKFGERGAGRVNQELARIRKRTE